jgi:hypothetical protein
VGVDAFRIAVLRDVLGPTGWVERAREFAARLRRATEPGGLMLVGTPQEEPWHMAAHLASEADLAGLPQLNPTLLRWAPPVGAPAHLTVGVDRLIDARRGESVLVVTEQAAPETLLERVERARRGGATVLALDRGDPDLEGLAHEVITLPGLGTVRTSRRASRLVVPSWWADDETPADGPAGIAPAGVDEVGGPGERRDERLPIESLVTMDVVQHLVATAATEPRPRQLSGWQRRLAGLLDRLSGPPSSPPW